MSATKATVFLGFLLALMRGAYSNPRGSKPNIIVFLADDLGIGDVGCFGNTTLATPNIDSIARDGVKFTQLLSAAAICTPSRAALLTGRYPVRSGMAGVVSQPVLLITPSTSALPSREITFAEVAKEAGYKTAIIGKWHLGLHQNWVGDNLNSPFRQGFDFWYGIPLSNLYEFDEEEKPILLRFFPNAIIIANSTILASVLVLFLMYKKNYIRVWVFVGLTMITFVVIQYPLWVYLNLNFINSMLYRNTELVEQPMQPTNLTKKLVHEGVSFLEENHEEDGPPLLLFMSWLQVHTRLHAGPEFRGKSKHGKYGDEVMELDWSVGEILKAIDRLGVRENTLVFFTSDNGGHSEKRSKDGDVQGGHNGIYRGSKGQGGMDGGMRVPSVLSWPGHVKPGQVIDVPLSSMDLFTTISDVTGVSLPTDRIIDGKSLLPLIVGESLDTPHDHLIHYCTDKIHAVRFKPDQSGAVWKVRYTTPKWLPGTENCLYVCHCDEAGSTFHEQPLVFDMTSDPREDQPMAVSDPRYPAIIKAASDAVRDHRESIGQVEVQLTFFKCLFRPYLMPCCNFPYCTCKDPKFNK